METKEQAPSQENPLVQEVRFMKVCVAVACCAMKPKNTSVRTFTEGLCTAFHNANQQLQHKHASLEAEILHLRQQIAITSMSSLETFHTQNESQADDAVLFPTPPLSGRDKQNRAVVEGFDLDSLHRNTQFLQSVINIQQVTRQTSQVGHLGDGDKNISASETKLKSLTSLNQTTVVKSLQTILKCVQDQTFTVSVKSLHHCIKCVVQLMDQLPALMSNMPVESIIKDILRCLVEGILQEDVSHSQPNIRQQRTNLVLGFSKPPVTRLTQEVLVEEIQKFSQHLQAVCRNADPLRVQWFENMIYVIQLLQIALGEEQSSPVTRDRDRLQGLKDKLEDSLLHVTHKFPLYAHSIWNVCGQLDLQLQK